MNNMLGAIVDWIYPPICISCKSIIPINEKDNVHGCVCSHCNHLFVPIKLPVCEKCGSPVSDINIKSCSLCFKKTLHFTCNRSTFDYDGIIRDILHDMKFRSRKQTAKGCGAIWAQKLDEEYLDGVDILVPIPLHKKKERERGFNQALVMAKSLSEAFDIPVAEDLLIRVKDTPPLSNLTPWERLEAMDGAFIFNEGYEVESIVICLIDDIYTTGATLSQAAKTLDENCNTVNIKTMTFAIALKNDENT